MASRPHRVTPEAAETRKQFLVENNPLIADLCKALAGECYPSVLVQKLVLNDFAGLSHNREGLNWNYIEEALMYMINYVPTFEVVKLCNKTTCDKWPGE